MSLLAGAIGGFLCDAWGIFAEGKGRERCGNLESYGPMAYLDLRHRRSRELPMERWDHP